MAFKSIFSCHKINISIFVILNRILFDSRLPGGALQPGRIAYRNGFAPISFAIM